MDPDSKTTIPPDPEHIHAKAAILAERDHLVGAGITFVAVHFDGCGDDGATEDVKCYKSDYYEDGEVEPVEHDVAHLQNHFEALVPLGYEDGCGGFGDVVFDVVAGTLKVIRNDRFEDYSTSSYEV